MPKFKDLTGKTFGKLTVIGKSEKKLNLKILWVCKCECGTIKEIKGPSMVTGKTKSCRCFLKETKYKHGLCSIPEYAIWALIKYRCTNPKCVAYNLYGGRGIKICDRWLSFENFYADMGTRPSKNYSIERSNNDGNYEPDNCKWATDFEQSRNRRSNVYIEYNGENLIVKDWAFRLGANDTHLSQFLKTHTFAEAVTFFSNPNRRKRNKKS